MCSDNTKSFNSTNRILINVEPEEYRIALTRDFTLENFYIEKAYHQRVGNIYSGVISSVAPSLDAVFVNFGAERQGFLPRKEIAPQYYLKSVGEEAEKYPLRELFKEGQEIIIQVNKEERGTKGAAITSFITLAGSYLVLMPNNPKAGGISRRIEGEERETLKETLSQLTIPEEMGLIIRTAGLGKSVQELQWDLEILLRHWQTIQETFKSRIAPFLIYQESDPIIKTIRDHLRPEIDEVIIDSEEEYTKAKQHIEQIRPSFKDNIKLYDELVPLFNRYQIESQVEMAFQKKVALPSGGTIVIEETEAMVTIDINSGRDTQGLDLESTAYNTNLEAVTVAAREIIKRDLSGIIIFDFIDMAQRNNQRKIEDAVQEVFSHDRARTQYGSISRFGVLEMSRQRLKPSLRESTNILCPRCQGEGSIRNLDSLALTLLRRIREYAMNHDTAEIRAEVPVIVASYLLNEKRHHLTALEQQRKIKIIITPNVHLDTPAYEVERVRYSDLKAGEESSASYVTNITPESLEETTPLRPHFNYEKPAIKHLPTIQGKPYPGKTGLLKRLWSTLFAQDNKASVALEVEEETTSPRPNRHNNRHRNNNRSQNENNRSNPRNRNDNRGNNHRRNERSNSENNRTPVRSQPRTNGHNESNRRQEQNPRRRTRDNHPYKQENKRNFSRTSNDQQRMDIAPQDEVLSQREPSGYEPQLASAANVASNRVNYDTPLTMQELKTKSNPKTARSRRTSRGARGTTGRKNDGSSFSAKKSLPSKRSNKEEQDK